MTHLDEDTKSVQTGTKYNAVGSIPISVASYSNSVTDAENETPTKHSKPAPKAYLVLVPAGKNIEAFNLKQIEGTIVELASRAKAKTIADVLGGTVLAPIKGV